MKYSACLTHESIEQQRHSKKNKTNVALKHTPTMVDSNILRVKRFQLPPVQINRVRRIFMAITRKFQKCMLCFRAIFFDRLLQTPQSERCLPMRPPPPSLTRAVPCVAGDSFRRARAQDRACVGSRPALSQVIFCSQRAR